MSKPLAIFLAFLAFPVFAADWSYLEELRDGKLFVDKTSISKDRNFVKFKLRETHNHPYSAAAFKKLHSSAEQLVVANCSNFSWTLVSATFFSENGEIVGQQNTGGSTFYQIPKDSAAYRAVELVCKGSL